MRQLGTFLVIFSAFYSIQAQSGLPELCSLAPDEGQNTDGSFVLNLHYDAAQDKCLPFKYFGSGGNGNRFMSEKDCMRNCSANAINVYPVLERDACLFPKASGECQRNYLRYYYDSVHHKCKKFLWSGCVGNGNRFLDLQACDNTCRGTTGLPEFCSLAPDEGQNTDGSFMIYLHYDAAQDKCLPFKYFGSGGNGNRFKSEKDCMRNCSANAINVYPVSERDACLFPKASGECQGNYLRYYYDSVHEKCKKFLWTGCVGNGNRFLDLQACNSTCHGTTGLPEFCSLAPDEGQNTDGSFVWNLHYDAAQDKCLPFKYFGSGGNGNRFMSEKDCMRNCSANAINVYPVLERDACLFPKASGECQRNYLRYYYDSVHHKCKKFLWSGCVGNGNRFLDLEACDSTCRGTTGLPEFCSLAPDEGQNTDGSFMIYLHYDAAQDKCLPFKYFGSGGNGNRFKSEKDCMRNCSANAINVYPVSERDACLFPKASGECQGNYLRYYYDSVHEKCKKFLWTGCVGNGNRFLDLQACNSTCHGTTGLPELCSLAPDEGQNTDGSFVLNLHYDAAQDKCLPFKYFGSGGNGNRFMSEKDCMRNCSANAINVYPVLERDACLFPKASGECQRNYLRYYYDSVHHKCKKFLWSGCVGNGNRFLDLEACDSTCRGTTDDGEEPEEEEPKTPVGG